MIDTDRPTVANVKRHAGIAGQVSVSADVTYPGETTRRAVFTGSTYGGPVVAQFGDLPQQFVTDPERFGSFADDPTAWVRRFFS